MRHVELKNTDKETTRLLIILTIAAAGITILAIMLWKAMDPTYFGEIANNTILNTTNITVTQNMTVYQVLDYCRDNKTTLKSRMTCINDYVKTIYKYVSREDYDPTMTVEKLIREGGDYRNWADFYKTVAIGMGYYSNIDVISMNENMNHAFIVVYDEEGYCVLDQKKIMCVEYVE